MTITGIIHVHSTLSHDGECTLDEIARLARARGYSFVGVTEHSETFDDGKMRRLIGECGRLSGPGLLMIPGLEFVCSKALHLLGVGAARFGAAGDPVSTARFIRAQGAVAILAHPSQAAYRVPAGLGSHLDGIEVWNARYDGPFVPNDQAIALWQTLRTENETLVAFGGQDFHGGRSRCHVKIAIPDVALREDLILRCLRQGNFCVSNPLVSLRANGRPGTAELAAIIAARRAYLRVKPAAKAVRDRWRTWRRKTLPPARTQGGLAAPREAARGAENAGTVHRSWR